MTSGPKLLPVINPIKIERDRRITVRVLAGAAQETSFGIDTQQRCGRPIPPWNQPLRLRGMDLLEDFLAQPHARDAFLLRVVMGRPWSLSVEEFHLLLREEQTAAYSVEIWKRFRKWSDIPTKITQ